MPNITVMQWNIEQFGLYKTADHRATVVHFITLMQQRYNFDVLIIQEFRELGEAMLPTIAHALSTAAQPWDYDYLPSAIKESSARVAAINLTYDDFGYTQNANHEGYAVIAKRNVLTPFAANHSYRSTVAAGSGLINLVVKGVQPNLAYDQNPQIAPRVYAGGGLRPANARFPVPSSRTIMPPDRIGVKRAAAVAALQDLIGDLPETLVWENCRRPCVVVLGGVVQVVTYHAPVSFNGPVYGTLAASLSGPLWPPNNVAIGGDFNLNERSGRNAAFLTLAGVAPAFGGVSLRMDCATQKVPAANLYLTDDNYQRSSTKYSEGQVTVLRPAGDSCLGSARDFAFSKVAAPVVAANTGVPDLFADMQLAAFAPLFDNANVNACVRDILSNAKLADSKIIPAFENAGDFARNLRNMFGAPRATGFPDRLSAAYFYKKFISDHLPTLMTFTIP